MMTTIIVISGRGSKYNMTAMMMIQTILRLHYPITLWTILLLSSLLLSPVLPEIIYRVDPLALLAATLRTYQRAGCDTEQLSLSCPRGTSISIELAQYGRAGDLGDNNLCPPVTNDDTTTILDGVVHSGTEIEVKPPESCLWPNALQYSLLQTVVEACQKKRHCKFAPTPKSIAGDPCPGIRKFVEIAYKCRPYEFRSKVACENDVIQLVCNPYSRIAIYSASFGRTEYESVQCSQPQGVKEETCLVSYATETVMQICHGRRRCTLSADSSTFGKPCRPDSRMYLKVVYTCIPRKVLKDRYDTPGEPDEPQQTELDLDQDELYDEDQFYKESEAIPPAPKLQGGISNPALSLDFPISGNPSTAIPPLLSRNENGSFDEKSLPLQNEKILKKTNPLLIPKYENGDIFGNDLKGHSSGEKKMNESQKKFFTRKNWKKILEKYEKPSSSRRNKNTDNNNNNNNRNNNDNKNDVTNLIINGEDNNNNNHSDDDISENPGNDYYDIDDDIGRNSSEKNISKWKEISNENEFVEKVEVIGFVAEWIQAVIFLTHNQERFYLYLIVSIASGILLCLLLVIGRLLIQKRRTKAETKFQQSSTGETQLPSGYSDDISEIDADIDLTTPLPVPSVSSRNETYLTYAPSLNTYGNLQSSSGPGGGAGSGGGISHTSTTMLIPQSGLIVTGGVAGGSITGSGCSRQPTPPPNLLGPSGTLIGPPVSGGMGALMPISSVSHHTTAPTYFTGAALMVGHHATLRRPLIPTSVGLITAAAPISSPSSVVHPPGASGGIGLGGLTTNICYDATLPRALSRGIVDNSQYMYG